MNKIKRLDVAANPEPKRRDYETDEINEINGNYMGDGCGFSPYNFSFVSFISSVS
jgi:hypothetical protein